jgi:hypothetical protein
MAVKSVKKVQPLKQPSPIEQQDAAAERETAAQSAMMDDGTRQKIAEKAYYRAQQRGFSPGYELEDWFAAETEVRNGARRDA